MQKNQESTQEDESVEQPVELNSVKKSVILN